MSTYYRITISSPTSRHGQNGNPTESFDTAHDTIADAWAYAEKLADIWGQSFVVDVHETTNADHDADVLRSYDELATARVRRRRSMQSWKTGVALRVLCHDDEDRKAVARLVRRGVLVKDHDNIRNRTDVYRAEEVPAKVAARL